MKKDQNHPATKITTAEELWDSMDAYNAEYAKPKGEEWVGYRLYAPDPDNEGGVCLWQLHRADLDSEGYATQSDLVAHGSLAYIIGQWVAFLRIKTGKYGWDFERDDNPTVEPHKHFGGTMPCRFQATDADGKVVCCYCGEHESVAVALSNAGHANVLTPEHRDNLKGSAVKLQDALEAAIPDSQQEDDITVALDWIQRVIK